MPLVFQTLAMEYGTMDRQARPNALTPVNSSNAGQGLASLPIHVSMRRVPAYVFFIMLAMLVVQALVYAFLADHQHSYIPLISTTAMTHPAAAVFRFGTAVTTGLYLLIACTVYGFFLHVVRDRQRACLEQAHPLQMSLSPGSSVAAGPSRRRSTLRISHPKHRTSMDDPEAPAERHKISPENPWLLFYDTWERRATLNQWVLTSALMSALGGFMVSVVSLDNDDWMHAIFALQFFFFFSAFGVLTISLEKSVLVHKSNERPHVIVPPPTAANRLARLTEHYTPESKVDSDHVAFGVPYGLMTDEEYSDVLTKVTSWLPWQIVLVTVMILAMITYAIVVPSITASSCSSRRSDDCGALHSFRSACEYVCVITYAVFIVTLTPIMRPWAVSVVPAATHLFCKQAPFSSSFVETEGRVQSYLATTSQPSRGQ